MERERERERRFRHIRAAALLLLLLTVYVIHNTVYCLCELVVFCCCSILCTCTERAMVVDHVPVSCFSLLNFVLMFASSLSTRARSASLFAELRMSAINTDKPRMALVAPDISNASYEIRLPLILFYYSTRSCLLSLFLSLSLSGVSYTTTPFLFPPALMELLLPNDGFCSSRWLGGWRSIDRWRERREGMEETEVGGCEGIKSMH